MSAASAVVIAITFVWLGMVLAISFLEAPLKFRAPGVTLQIGLGIGRRVFRALNSVEVLFAVAIIVCLTIGDRAVPVVVALAVAFVALAVQLIAVRPALTRRSDAVLAGQTGSRSRGHYVYVGLEILKAIALTVSGVLMFAT
jgi:hypothetical protein